MTSTPATRIEPPRPTPEGELPLVTVAMPIYNEERYIAASLDRVLAQDYPAERIEIIIADGMSTDNTRAIIAEYQQKCPRIQMHDNVKRFRAAALNVAIEKSKGDVIVFVDGHCEVAGDFISQELRLLKEHPDAWLAGGPVVHKGRTPFGKATAIAMSHPCGVGNATHRFAEFEGYGEGAAFSAFHRWVFDRVGMFDEVMVRTEDDELNYRIAQAGGRAFISPRVRYEYFVRDSVRTLFQQYAQYGFWRIPVMRKHKRPTTARQIVPLLFFLTVLALLVVGGVLGNPWIALALPAIYLAVLAAIGVLSIRRSGLAVAARVPLAMATLHLAYAWGMGYGFFAALFRPRAFESGSGMSQQKR